MLVTGLAVNPIGSQNEFFVEAVGMHIVIGPSSKSHCAKFALNGRRTGNFGKLLLTR